MFLPKMTGRAGQSVSNTARMMAKPILRTTSDAVADSAIRNRLLPGLFRSGTGKTSRKLTGATEDVAEILKGPEGANPTKTLGIQGGPGIQFARSKPHIQSVKDAIGGPISEAIAEMSKRPAARDAFGFSRDFQNRGLGHTTDAGLGSLASASDIRARVGQAAPSTQQGLALIDDIEPVAHAYGPGRGVEGRPVSSQGAGVSWGVVGALLNRLYDPSAQGTGDLGRLMQSRTGQGAAQGARAASVIGDDAPDEEALIQALRARGIEDLLRER